MNCINHPDRTAVRQCPQCLSFYCAECSEKFIDGICPSCYNKKKQINSTLNGNYYRKQLVKIFIYSAISFIFIFCCYKSDILSCPLWIWPAIILISIDTGSCIVLSPKVVDRVFSKLAGDGGMLIYSIVFRWIAILLAWVVLSSCLIVGLIYCIRTVRKYTKAKAVVNE